MSIVKRAALTLAAALTAIPLATGIAAASPVPPTSHCNGHGVVYFTEGSQCSANEQAAIDRGLAFLTFELGRYPVRFR